MNNSRVSVLRPMLWLGCIFLIATMGTGAVHARETKLDVQLVWGTNEESSSNPDHKPLEAPLAKKLGMFKWKNYFTVNRKEVSVSDKASEKIQLSSKCEIVVKRLNGSRYEINVFGQGKHVRKITEKITKQDSLVIAGDDKNDCAWFILIRED